MFDTLKKNKYFFFSFLLWVVVGAVLLCMYSHTTLFFAVNNNYSKNIDILMSVCTEFGAHIIPVLLLIVFVLPAMRTKKYILNVLLYLAIPLCMYVLKIFFDTPRPLQMYGMRKVHFVPWLTNLFECSFPSGHTMAGFGMATLIVLFLPAKNKIWGMLFFIIALSVAYSRLYLGQHFFADVYAGSILGVAIVLFNYILIDTYLLWKK